MNKPLSAWRLLFNNRLGFIGLLVLSLLVLVALITPLLPLLDPNLTAPANRLIPPFSNPEYILGTDHLGRDLLSRLLWGMRASLAVGIAATLIAGLLGSIIGLIAGFAGGHTDNLLMRGIDMLMAFPYILLALAIVAALGPGLINALYAIAIVNIPFFARNVRGVTLTISQREFIDAARMSGQSSTRILFSEILPNVMPVIVITVSTTLGWMVLETAGLSFLGLGAQPPQADLGSMLGDGRKFMFSAEHLSVLPGLLIFFLVMAINLTGDGIRDVIDPRLKSGVLSRPGARTRIAGDRQVSPMPTKDCLLQVRNLTTSFNTMDGTYPAVRDVSFDLHEGECLGLVGESGSGKSVTAMSLTGLVASPPGIIAAGSVYFDGRDLLSVSQEQLRRIRGAEIAHVFQDSLSALHPMFSVGEQIVEAVRAHRRLSYKAARKIAVELLAQVHIDEPLQRFNAYPHQLSGGMRQRISIAMALAHSPKLIIADEPTTALDVTVQAGVLRQLDQLRRRQNTSLLLITHDFAVVSQNCDKVAVMYAGQIVESGSTKRILQAPRHPYTQMLIQCIPVLGYPDQPINTIDGMPPGPEQLESGCAFATRCPYGQSRCQTRLPALNAIDEQHQVRCWYPLPEPEAQ